MEEKNMGGRPRLTSEQIAERKSKLLQKVEPYLKSGLSVNKSLHEAKIYNSEFYKFMATDEGFRDKIELFKQYISVLVNFAFFHELMAIVEKQNGDEAKNIPPQELDKEDLDFLMWFGLHSNSCREEWGRRDNINLEFDPEMEIQKIKRLVEIQ